jgi:hypothetical protein
MNKNNYLRSLIFALLMWWTPLLCFGVTDLTDPTRPPSVDSVRTGMYDLSEIIVGPQRKTAVLGGHLFHEGEEFQDITVLEITPNQVKIKGTNGIVTLTLFKSPLSRPVSPSKTNSRLGL